MKKLLTLIFFISAFASAASAQVEFETIKSHSQVKLQVVGFFDYYPFGQYQNNEYSGVFKPFIEYFSKYGKYILDYMPISKNYEDTIRDVVKGEADIVLGMYAETSLYSDLKYIYPAAIDNPVHLVMLPSRIGEVRSVGDLKNLKGAVHAKERFSDYVKDRLNDLKVEYVDNSYDLYGKLIRGEIDYVLTGIYFGTIETAKLGLRHQVAFSRQGIWNMPVFIGISKASFHREYLSHTLSVMLGKPETREKIKNDMMEIVNGIISQYAGTVPPTYIKKETPPPPAQTPPAKKGKSATTKANS